MVPKNCTNYCCLNKCLILLRFFKLFMKTTVCSRLFLLAFHWKTSWLIIKVSSHHEELSVWALNMNRLLVSLSAVHSRADSLPHKPRDVDIVKKASLSHFCVFTNLKTSKCLKAAESHSSAGPCFLLHWGLMWFDGWLTQNTYIPLVQSASTALYLLLLVFPLICHRSGFYYPTSMWTDSWVQSNSGN